MDLITVPQLASRLQVDSALIDVDVAELAVRTASGLIRAVSRQQVTFVSQETVTLAGGERILTLPQRPLVVDVANPLTVVEVDQFGGLTRTAVEGTDYSRIGNELTRGWPWWWTGAQTWPFRPLGVWQPTVRVTYSHGYQVVPDGIVSVALDVAQSLYSNPEGLRAQSIGDYSETYASELLGAATVGTLRTALRGIGLRRGAFSI